MDSLLSSGAVILFAAMVFLSGFVVAVVAMDTTNDEPGYAGDGFYAKPPVIEIDPSDYNG